MTEMEPEHRAADQAAKKAKAAAASNTAGKVVWMYVGYQESGDWDTFSDELEASRYALNGASKARVEKRELKKRAK